MITSLLYRTKARVEQLRGNGVDGVVVRGSVGQVTVCRRDRRPAVAGQYEEEKATDRREGLRPPTAVGMSG